MNEIEFTSNTVTGASSGIWIEDEDEDDGGSRVREPRRPKPNAPMMAMALGTEE